jgi:hypothetical protein
MVTPNPPNPKAIIKIKSDFLEIFFIKPAYDLNITGQGRSIHETLGNSPAFKSRGVKKSLEMVKRQGLTGENKAEPLGSVCASIKTVSVE